MGMENAIFLVVEDSPTMRQLISFSLKRFKNARIIEAVDGVDALKKLSGPEQIDLILSDVRLRSLQTGVDLARLAKAKGIPTLFATGHDLPDAAEVAVGVLRKPYSDRQLKAALDAAREESTAADARAGRTVHRGEPAAAGGLDQPGGKLPLFDRDGQRVDARTVQTCIDHGWAEPWFANPLKPIGSHMEEARAKSLAAKYRWTVRVFPDFVYVESMSGTANRLYRSSSTSSPRTITLP